jgi:SAM-dependent methyltransferase
MDDKPPASDLFNAYYYAHDCGEPYLRNEIWLNRFDAFAYRICQDIQPSTVLDAGCALGMLVEVLRKRGVQAWGVDISEFAIQNVHADIRPFCKVGSITEPFEFPRYDLIVSIEVLEHLPEAETDKAIANLCQHSDDILFSSTPYDYHEATHFNVHPTEYWVECFARYGFFRDVDFDASFITPWAIRFRCQKLTLANLARDYERRFMPLLNENIVLRREVIDNRSRLDYNERNIAHLEEKSLQLGQGNQELEQRNQELEHQLSEVHNQLSQSAQRIGELEQANAENLDLLHDKQSQLNLAVSQVSELTEALAQQNASFTNRIAQLEQEKQALASNLESIHQRWLYKLYQTVRRPFQ